MSHLKSPLIALFSSAILSYTAVSSAEHLEEVTVIADHIFKDTSIVSPTSVITIEELEAINFVNVEDALAHEPSLVVRKRFIGDPNGVIGLRGSNQFQTARSLVFVDGLPLHYHLQTRFRGSPRWSLVSPGEIESAEIIYGPYSSEYSGNSIGGVVNIATRRPESERIQFEAGYFSQEYDQLGTDERYDGYRTFLSYENKFDKLGIFASYTRLENDSQPLFQYFAEPTTRDADAVVDSGAISGVNEFGQAGIYFGDSGAEHAETDLYKLKLFYDLDTVQLRGSIAYEDRDRRDRDSNNFLLDSNGNAVFDRSVDVDGTVFDTFEFGRSRFQDRRQERDSLLIGLGASFELPSNWVGDVFYSYFDIIKDEEIRTGSNPDSPDFVADNESFRARITDYDDTGWQIFDAKFSTDSLAGDDKQRLSLGAHYDDYELNFIVDDFNSIAGVRDADELDNNLATGRADSGGKARTTAIFAQYGYRFNEQWDASVGLRYEDWQAEDGFTGATETEARNENGWSPKFSLAWTPTDEREIRYSVARALRFPIIEELYVNDDDVDGGIGFSSDPTLEPEDGIFHNLSFSQAITSGNLRFNLFHDVVDDVIFNQQATNGVTTFLPVGEVTTRGAEFIWEQTALFNLPLDLRFNLSHIDTEITDNEFNPEFEGNDFPRSPEWRSNLLLSYRLSTTVDLGGSIRYASNSFDELDNSDTESNVFGAQDDYTFVGLKANWQATKELKLSAGIDNIFNEEAFTFHPWPGRTYHVQIKYVIGE